MAEGSQPSSRPLPHQKRTFDDGDDDLHVFSYKGEYDRALLCLLKGTNCDVKNDWRQTPLHLATSAGHLNIMLLLLDSGACVNERDHQDLTPLHQAVIHGNKKCAELLLCFGGSPHNSEDIVDCRSPLELAETLPLIYSFIESKAGIVQELQHLCRIAIRRIMGVTRRKRMRELPIPRQLISFLSTLPLSFADELLSDREKRRERKYAKKPPSSKSSSLVLQTLKEPL